MTKERERSEGAAAELELQPVSHLARLQEAEATKKALLSRPRLSLRVQVLLGFLVVFLFAVGIAGFIISSIYEVEDRIHFLEIVNDYVLEVDQARRWEKNFFLYGSNLSDSLDASYRAETILKRNRTKIGKVVGRQQWRRMHRNVVEYQREVKRLIQLTGRRPRSTQSGDKHLIEMALRKKGHRMIVLAENLRKRERRALETAIAHSRRIQTYSLVFLLFFMISTAYLISGHILRSLRRFERYTDQIAAGDFTPISPRRRYRDEFTNLAVSINHMMQELQKHEAMLIQAHKMRAIGTLTAGVAHELNNPLNNISITAHMLLEDFQELSEEDCRDMVADIVSEGDRVKKIVSNLLDFTRESETRLQPLDLVQLLRDTVVLARNQIKVSGIDVDLTAAEGLPKIMGDRQQLAQVFLNLILNAIAASERGDQIEIRVQAANEPDHLCVKVIDHGCGIPEHVVGRIFDPFFTTKETGKGTGLGLSVSQGIVAKHAGRMLVESREGSGTTFTVLLPTR